MCAHYEKQTCFLFCSNQVTFVNAVTCGKKINAGALQETNIFFLILLICLNQPHPFLSSYSKENNVIHVGPCGYTNDTQTQYTRFFFIKSCYQSIAMEQTP